MISMLCYITENYNLIYCIFIKNNFLGISYLKVKAYKQEFITSTKLDIACVQI